VAYKRRPGEPITSGMNYLTTISFLDSDTLREKLLCILSFVEKDRRAPTKELEAAIDYVSALEVTGTESPGAYEFYRDFVVSPGLSKLSLGREVANPAARPDFFDTLRSLDDALKQLSRQIRAINDPARITPEIRAVRAYLDAFREFLDVDCGQAPQGIPKDLPVGLVSKLRRIDWRTVSDAAHKWADLIVKILMGL
jgi:hypothetical protein